MMPSTWNRILVLQSIALSPEGLSLVALVQHVDKPAMPAGVDMSNAGDAFKKYPELSPSWPLSGAFEWPASYSKTVQLFNTPFF